MRFAAALVAAAALATAAAASGGTDRATRCKPGVKAIGTTIVRTFCGPARATVKLRGRTYSFRNGSCKEAGAVEAFSVNVGTLTVGKTKPRYKYFGAAVTAARHDGVYRRAVVGWAVNGKRYSLYSVRVRLAGGRTRGTFSGRIIGGGRASGSFRCK